MNLQGKRIVLTGSSSGIGLELLSLLHDKGAKIVAVDSQKPSQTFPRIKSIIHSYKLFFRFSDEKSPIYAYSML